MPWVILEIVNTLVCRVTGSERLDPLKSSAIVLIIRSEAEEGLNRDRLAGATDRSTRQPCIWPVLRGG